MQSWSVFIEARGDSRDAEDRLVKAIDELRSKGHDVMLARFTPSTEQSKDVSRKYADTSAR